MIQLSLHFVSREDVIHGSSCYQDNFISCWLCNQGKAVNSIKESFNEGFIIQLRSSYKDWGLGEKSLCQRKTHEHQIALTRGHIKSGSEISTAIRSNLSERSWWKRKKSRRDEMEWLFMMLKHWQWSQQYCFLTSLYYTVTKVAWKDRKRM